MPVDARIQRLRRLEALMERIQESRRIASGSAASMNWTTEMLLELTEILAEEIAISPHA